MPTYSSDDPHHLNDFDGPDKCPHCHEEIDERDTPVEFEDGNHGHAGCKADYDDEHRDEPPMSLYALKTYCLVCNNAIREDEKSRGIPGGFIHADSSHACLAAYEEAIDLIEATSPKDAA